MRRAALVALILTGCGSAPQANLMDRVFPSRNACAPPPQMVAPQFIAPPPVAVAPAPMVPAAAAESGCGHCGRKDCRLCNPFRIFRRNR